MLLRLPNTILNFFKILNINSTNLFNFRKVHDQHHKLAILHPQQSLKNLKQNEHV